MFVPVLSVNRFPNLDFFGHKTGLLFDYTFFLYKNLAYKNIRLRFCSKFKDIVVGCVYLFSQAELKKLGSYKKKV